MKESGMHQKEFDCLKSKFLISENESSTFLQYLQYPKKSRNLVTHPKTNKNLPVIQILIKS